MVGWLPVEFPMLWQCSGLLTRFVSIINTLLMNILSA